MPGVRACPVTEGFEANVTAAATTPAITAIFKTDAQRISSTP
jgi:hypothetical protein